MDVDELFHLEAPTALGGSSQRVLDVVMLEQLRRAPLPSHPDVAAAMALVDLVHTDLEAFGTSGGERLDDAGMRLALRSMQAVLARLGIDAKMPFRDFNSFRGYWLKNDGYGSWQARRDLLEGLFDPVHAKLYAAEERALAAELAEPISPHTTTGWVKVDQEVAELRRRFRDSRTPQDYRTVGTCTVGVLEALGRVVYQPARHLRPGEVEPPPDKTKQRIGRYIEDAVPGSSNTEVRGLATKAVELAHHVKHSETPSRRDAGIAADAVILLANICRRLEQEL